MKTTILGPGLTAIILRPGSSAAPSGAVFRSRGTIVRLAAVVFTASGRRRKMRASRKSRRWTVALGAPTLGNAGNTTKLYSVAIPGAANVDGVDSIAGLDVRTVEKMELLNLDVLGIPLDNVEGMTIGPRLPDGRRSLVLVSDNNFAASQFTQSSCSRSGTTNKPA
jgi:Esterase-like activity of phytase